MLSGMRSKKKLRVYTASEAKGLIKSKDGTTTLTQPEQIQTRWCEHYKDLLNRHPVVDESVLDLTGQRETLLSLDDVPSREEIHVDISVKRLNNHKAPGMDGITAEILKCGSEKTIGLLHVVILDVLETEAPQD